MNNPYANEQETVDFRIGRSAAYAIIYLFLLLVTLPPLYRNLASSFAPVRALFSPERDTDIVAHLHAAEKEIEDAPFAEPLRRAVQSALTLGPLREGNTKTHIGKDGWLYFKTALDAMTGYGPLEPEPDSVAKNPNRKPWKSPLGAITTFAAQLAETDTRLLLVPIPVKPMIYPEHLGIETDGPILPPDEQNLYFELEMLPNVNVLDLSETFWRAKKDTQLFLKQDTHWTPDAVWIAAEQVAGAVGSMGIPVGDPPASPTVFETRESYGDLVEKLGIGTAGFSKESVEVGIIPSSPDTSSPFVLLGDSFTNIYADSRSLDWGDKAGFGAALAQWIGAPLDVIAINGGGATEARETLSRRRGAAAMMKEKKLVIWAIAARDLFLSETAAKNAKVEWDDVTFDTRAPKQKPAVPPGATVVRAKLVARPDIPDPKSTAYKSLLYVAEYQLLETLSGEAPELEDDRFLVVHWAFEKRVLKPSADYPVDSERDLTLLPFEDQSDLASLEVRSDSELFLDYLWDAPIAPAVAEDEDVVSEAAATEGAAKAEPTGISPIPASGCVIWMVALGLALRRQSRAGLSH